MRLNNLFKLWCEICSRLVCVHVQNIFHSCLLSQLLKRFHRVPAEGVVWGKLGDRRAARLDGIDCSLCFHIGIWGYLKYIWIVEFTCNAVCHGRPDNKNCFKSLCERFYSNRTRTACTTG